MLDSSRDILNIVIAFCVLLFTVVMVWLLSYFIRMLRDTTRMVHEASAKVEEIGRILDTLKDRVSSSATTVAVAAKGVSEIASFLQKRRTKKRSTGSSKGRGKGENA